MHKKILSMAIIVLMVFTAVPFMGGLSPDSEVSAATNGTKLVAITFDDGPSGYTAQLLDGLKARGAHATFFMTAKNGSHGINNHSDVLSRMIDEGHQLANHSYDHPSIGKLSGAQVANEFGAVESLLFQAMGGSYYDMIRTPGGAVNSTIQANCGAPIILWSVDTLDWKNRNADTVYNNIVNKTGDGSIILLHDLYQTSVQGALRAIDTLQARGYEFVTVAELMRRRGVIPVNGKSYTSVPSSGADLPAYSAPTLVPAADTSGSFTVSAYVSEPGVSFYYTTDGSAPSMKSPAMTGPVTISSGTTIKVIGIDRYGTRTPVAEASYTYTKYGQLYSDVPASAWYYDTVSEIAHSGLMSGVDTYSFNPDGNLTRGMMVTVLYRYDQSRKASGQKTPSVNDKDKEEETPAKEDENKADQKADEEKTDKSELSGQDSNTDDEFKQYETSPDLSEVEASDLTADSLFEDVSPDAWYYNAVCWASENGITNGTDASHFSPDQSVTREQIACMIYNYVKPKGTLNSTEGNFSDWYMVSDWSKQPVLWCLENGIMGGNDNGELLPDANATRAQCAAMLLRLNNAVSKIY